MELGSDNVKPFLQSTELLPIYISKKIGFSIGDVIWIFNILIFAFAAYLFSVETALYSILIYLSASKTVDFIVDGVEEYMGVSIISPKNEDVRRMITQKLGRGVTVLSGKGGFGETMDGLRHVDIVYTVVTRLELAELNMEIERIDSGAFVTMERLKEIRGGMVKKRTIKDR
jgi:uncharacterized membrane-anchored protein YitT (DUF2179 family)